jgi:glycosyltransferase involved in cell wall biosynthesis
LSGTILQVVTDNDRRGAQVFATDLHHALVARGRDVRTVALAGGAVGGLEWPVLGPGRRHPSTIRALRTEATRASVVIAHGSTTLPLCALVRPTTRTPFVYRQISESLFWASTWSRRLRVRTALRASSRVVALWEGASATLTDTLGVRAGKIRIVPNGVPSSGFPRIEPGERSSARVELGLPVDDPVVLSIGALAPEKGVDLAVRATSGLPSTHLLVAGDGPERASLEALADEVAPGRVTFTGSVRDPRICFAAADVVVLPSRGGDSMPAVLIEAGFLGLPSVATPVEGIVEILDHGRAGELVTRDDVASLQSGLARVLDDPGHAARLATAARDRCLANYDIDVVAAEWDRVLREVERSVTS